LFVRCLLIVADSAIQGEVFATAKEGNSIRTKTAVAVVTAWRGAARRPRGADWPRPAGAPRHCPTSMPDPAVALLAVARPRRRPAREGSSCLGTSRAAVQQLAMSPKWSARSNHVSKPERPNRHASLHDGPCP
jgi:hypothetical protein